MKTQQELLLHYWGPHYDMVKEYNAKHGTNIRPWECVKHVNEGKFDAHPQFAGKPWNYTFALTILYDDKRKEHRAVFVGDKVYHKETGIERTIRTVALMSDFAEKFSWNPPTPKRTFKIGDVDLPCPVYTPHNDNVVKVGIYTEETGGTDYFMFETLDQAIKVKQAICEILSAARDKV